MNDTRAKLEQLFRRLSDPAVSDLDALADFVRFRKLALDAKDVREALGAPAAGGTDTVGHPADKPSTPTDGPMWPFKKKHAGKSIAHIARVDSQYLHFMLDQDYVWPLLKAQIRAALGISAPPSLKATPDATPAGDDSDPPF